MLTREQAAALCRRMSAGHALYNTDLILDMLIEASKPPESSQPVAWLRRHYDRRTGDEVAIQYSDHRMTYQFDVNHPYRIGDAEPLYLHPPKPADALRPEEQAELLKHRTSLELLEGYHESNAAAADAQDVPHCVKHHSERAKLFRSMIDALPVRKCAATISTDPPMDCDAPFCGCNPEWQACIKMLVESGWQSPQSLAQRTPFAWRRATLCDGNVPDYEIHVGSEPPAHSPRHLWQPLYAHPPAQRTPVAWFMTAPDGSISQLMPGTKEPAYPTHFDPAAVWQPLYRE